MNVRRTPKTSTKIFQTLRRIFLLLGLLSLQNGVLRAFEDGTTPGETVIVNRADASYEDADGATYSTVSPTVIVTVARVPAISVTPDETQSSATVAANERVTRLFQICNTGNANDSFAPTSGTVSAPAALAQVFFDTDSSGTVTPADAPVQFGQTSTPNLAPGACHGVLFVVDTNAVAVGSQVVMNLSARSTLTIPGTNDFASDSGTIINSVGSGGVFTSPTDTNLPPVKLVENQPRVAAAPGQILNYSIAFRNNGAVAARQVRITDDLPAELEYAANTLRLNNRSLTDAADADEGTASARRFEILIPEIAPGAVTEIKFQARLIGASGGSGVINSARLSAANAPAVNSSEAVAVVNPVGTVYAGNTAGATRIAGARVTVATDESGSPLNLTPDIGYAPNQSNANPFVTDASGSTLR